MIVPCWMLQDGSADSYIECGPRFPAGQLLDPEATKQTYDGKPHLRNDTCSFSKVATVTLKARGKNVPLARASCRKSRRRNSGTCTQEGPVTKATNRGAWVIARAILGVP